MITFTDVSKRYPDGTVAVDGLNLEIPEGSLTVFVGPSGCGKTTSMRMINRMVAPTTGVVTLAGQDVSTVDPVTLRLGIGYVIQSGGLMPHQRVIDNVACVPILKGQSRRAARRAAYEVLARVGLDPKLGERYPGQLSGGQQQRVGVARALAADPPVLLMDEPFSAVDPVVRAELQEELLRLQRELAKTIVFVTHDIDEATILGDKVAVFAVGGHLAQYATPEEILRAPVDDFVAGFVGRDRGFRHLSFSDGESVPVHQVTMSQEPTAVSEWTLLVSAEQHPLGWLSPGRPGELVPGGSLFQAGETLRRALDAALSSPAGLGVAVDGSGAVTGVVKAVEVLEAIERARVAREG